MKISKFFSIVERDTWLRRFLPQFAGIHAATKGLDQLIVEWATSSLHHIGFQPFENLDLEVRNTRRRSALPSLESDRATWVAVVVEKYYILGHLDDETEFGCGALEIDGEFWGDPTADLSQGESSVKQAIEIWSRSFRNVDKKIFKVDAVVKVTTAHIGFGKESSITVYRPSLPFVLSKVL